MKHLKITLAALLLTSVSFAQTSTDEVELIEKEVKTITKYDGTKHEIKHIVKTERIKDVELEKEDQYKLNQDLKLIPVRVSKTIMLDYDKDPAIDSELNVKYAENEYMSLDFRLKREGLTIISDGVVAIKSFHTKEKIESNMITKNGIYDVVLEDKNTITIVVNNYEMK